MNVGRPDRDTFVKKKKLLDEIRWMVEQKHRADFFVIKIFLLPINLRDLFG